VEDPESLEDTPFEEDSEPYSADNLSLPSDDEDEDGTVWFHPVGGCKPRAGQQPHA
jgi:hypothetical protein